MSKKNFIIFILFMIAGITSFLFVSQPATDYFNKESEIYFDSTDDFKKINKEYVSKIVTIKGQVTNVNSVSPFLSVTLDGSFLFSFDMSKTNSQFIIQDQIVIKARFVGYDDLFDEYSFTDCKVVE
ncbi:MAG: hypothetical protein HOA52_02670 [Flavobacteriales bacterium]|jgi:hypothetical protein|nr:hypothetical protein [Flavobacteriales bacterium]MBT6808373.1 hypothetical protein [Flavobacteriales bacterium]